MYPVKNYKTIKRSYTHGVKTFYSDFHLGIDLIVSEGTPIIAPFDCEVKTMVGKQGGNTIHVFWGKYVMRCLHLKSLPKAGKYKQGEIIGYSGNTGLSTAPHIHLDLSPAPLNLNNIKNFIDPDKFNWEEKMAEATFTGDFGGKKTTKNAEGWYNSAVSYRQRLINEQTAHKATKDAWAKESKDLANQLQKTTKENAELKKEIKILVAENETLELQTAMLPALEEDIRTLEARIEDLTSDLFNSHNERIKLEEKLENGLTGWQMVVEGIRKMFSK